MTGVMGEEKPASICLTPKLQAFVLADQVYVDALSAKKVICGTFNALWGEKFPTCLQQTSKAYLCMTNCRGQQKIHLKYVDLETGNVLMESSDVVVESSDPIQIQEVVMDVPPLPMPHPGSYAMDAYSQGEQIGSIRILVCQKGESVL